MEEEIWKPIEGDEEYYSVSNKGRVKSNDRKVWNGFGYYLKKERILKNVLNPSTGYYHVVLCNGNGDKNTYTIHKLVAEAFVEGYSKELIVNHKDENKANNNANNLEWCTYKYNNEYNGKHKKSCKPVIQYDKNMNFINVFESAREASRILKIQYKNISACCRGLRNSCGGYKWKFKEEF